jgi:hypothetical protein
VACRSAGDINILVAAVAGAIEVVEPMDWRWQRPSQRSAELPPLHETLTHSTLPRVELHWRAHSYEDRFAADALQRAERPDAGAPLRMLPADGLATLTLIYARDGLSGLRTPADIAAWSDTRCPGEDPDARIDSIARAYPALEAPVRVGTAARGPPGGPTIRSPSQQRFRWTVAAELATPFYEGGDAQVRANASLVDLLLAPAQGSRASLRPELQRSLKICSDRSPATMSSPFIVLVGSTDCDCCGGGGWRWPRPRSVRVGHGRTAPPGSAAKDHDAIPTPDDKSREDIGRAAEDVSADALISFDGVW